MWFCKSTGDIGLFEGKIGQGGVENWQDQALDHVTAECSVGPNVCH